MLLPGAKRRRTPLTPDASTPRPRMFAGDIRPLRQDLGLKCAERSELRSANCRCRALASDRGLCYRLQMLVARRSRSLWQNTAIIAVGLVVATCARQSTANAPRFMDDVVLKSARALADLHLQPAIADAVPARSFRVRGAGIADAPPLPTDYGDEFVRAIQTLLQPLEEIPVQLVGATIDPKNKPRLDVDPRPIKFFETWLADALLMTTSASLVRVIVGDRPLSLTISSGGETLQLESAHYGGWIAPHDIDGYFWRAHVAFPLSEVRAQPDGLWSDQSGRVRLPRPLRRRNIAQSYESDEDNFWHLVRSVAGQLVAVKPGQVALLSGRASAHRPTIHCSPPYVQGLWRVYLAADGHPAPWRKGR